MTERLLDRAQAGDEHAFRELTDPYRRELQFHCYRMLGSVQDAEDMLQETLLAAWRGLERFERRASLRAWLYRIATNRCLNALRDDARGQPPRAPDPPFQPPEPTHLVEPTRLEPYPDPLLEGIAHATPGPEARYETREAIELAFIAALLQLPPRQQAVFVLRDVLGFHTSEVAEMLDSTEASIKGALQRARATLDEGALSPGPEWAPAPHSSRERELARRFADAFEADDIDGIVALLTEDAWLAMPPSPLAYQGQAMVASFLRASARYRAGRRFRLRPTRANTQPAFALYVEDAKAPIAHATGLIVLTLAGDRIAAITRFLDTSVLARFGFPPKLHE
jgi:RNA polymerase sigma-70 factor (TIGR02960 family)